jgi:Uri superfamily endonuclease
MNVVKKLLPRKSQGAIKLPEKKSGLTMGSAFYVGTCHTASQKSRTEEKMS